MLASNLPEFQRWYLADTAPSPSIVLHGFPEVPPGIAPAVAKHLNEFDDDSGGNWSAFSHPLIRMIAAAPDQRRLLGLGDSCANCPPDSPCGRRKVLAALARRGQAVLDCMFSLQACEELTDVFRIALGPAPVGVKNIHLVIQRELFADRALPSIIGDTYLEWVATRGMAETV